MDFKETLRSKGAREFHIVALGTDEERALAAIAEAERRGVDQPIPYALTLFEDPTWTPRGRAQRVQLTNQAVEVTCVNCGNDRFVPVTADVTVLYGESYAPCQYCNAGADTSRWVGQERRVTAPR